jgi:ribonucleoside-triphosphate reductase (thioredoxin)
MPTATRTPTISDSLWDEIEVIKREGRTVEFDPDLIHTAISRAFKDTGEKITNKNKWVLVSYIANQAKELALKSKKVITVEQIQDMVVEALFANGYHKTGESYVLFRNNRQRLRDKVEISPEDLEKFRESRRHLPTDLQMFQHLNKYSRYQEDKGRRETWVETVDRVITFFQGQVSKYKKSVAPEHWEELRTDLMGMHAFPSMRTVQMAGPPAEREHIAVFNCAFCAIQKPRDFAEILYVLMQGTGLGFTVEYEYVEDLPKVRKQKGKPPIKHVIPDSTEGWCEALRIGIEAWFDGLDIVFDYSKIRPAGAVLKIKGGRASGPDPLQELLEFTRARMLTRQNKRLRSIDVHDIACKIGKIVQVGGVRRAAMISLSALEDADMRDAKHGEFWNHNAQRTMANNSAVYEEKPEPLVFMREWLSLAESGSGERGIFNRGSLRKNIPKRRKYKPFGTNPCGEIVLRNRQFCNLSIAVCRTDDTVATLHRKVRSATIFGTLQSMLTDFGYISSEWRDNCDEECLLGVDLAGALDCPLIRDDTEGELLNRLRTLATEVNEEWADMLGINRSRAVTCVKPGGNSGVFLNCGHAVTGWVAPYIKRHVRVNAIDPMAQFLIDQGVPHCPDYDETDVANPRVWVFAFPLKAPEGAVVCSEVENHDGVLTLESRTTALDQLDMWARFKTHWTDHNPSVTINVSPHEWLEVGNWVLTNWDIVGGLSFLPRSGRVYPLAPMQEITAAEYKKLVKDFPVIEWEKFFRYEMEDTTTLAGDFACVGGACTL